MNDNLREFINLVNENPELPVIASVHGEIVGDNCYSTWMGKIGKCSIDEYLIDEWYGHGCMRFKSSDAEEDIIEGIAEMKYDGMPEDYDRAEKEVSALWKKAVFLNIVLPSEMGEY